MFDPVGLPPQIFRTCSVSRTEEQSLCRAPSRTEASASPDPIPNSEEVHSQPISHGAAAASPPSPESYIPFNHTTMSTQPPCTYLPHNDGRNAINGPPLLIHGAQTVSPRSMSLDLHATFAGTSTLTQPPSDLCHPHEDEQKLCISTPPYGAMGASNPGESMPSGTDIECIITRSDSTSKNTFVLDGSTSPSRDGTQASKVSQSALKTPFPTLGHLLGEPNVPTSSNLKWHWRKFWFWFSTLRRRSIPWCPGWILWCILAICLALSFGIPLGLVLRIRDFGAPSDDETMESVVQLGTTLAQVDPIQRTMTFYWFVLAAMCTRKPCEDYDILFDQNILGNNTGSNNIPSSPAFFVNGTIFNLTADDPLYKYGGMSVFKTELTAIYGDTIDGTLKNYPFDHYRAELFIFAKARRDIFNIEDVVPISIKSVDGIAAGYTLSINQDKTVNDGSACASLIIEIARGAEVQLYGVVIMVAIWLITMVLVSTTVSAVFLGRKMAKEVMVLPVATLFAFTQLRQSLPGAPPDSGAIIDFIGVLPCLAILALCSVLQLAVFLFRDPTVDRNEDVHAQTV